MIAPRLALLAALTLIVARPGAQDTTSAGERITVGGRVTNAESGQPLSDAQVYVPGTSFGTLSGADGRFVLVLDDEWIGKEVTIRVERVGYAAAERAFTMAATENVLDFALDAQSLSLDEIVVTGKAARERSAAPPAGIPPGRALPGRYNPRFNTESYARIVENDFRSAETEPLSTFSIDVDRASYSNVRRYLRDGARPPIDAVRIEELVNYFPYSDPEPDGDTPFSLTTEVAAAPWQPLHRLVRIGLRARSIDLRSAPPNNLVFLLDVSGSMDEPSKLPLLKTAMRMLVDQLRPQDRIAIVVYAGAAGLVLPSTSGAEKETILDAIERLKAGGSTAGGAGIRLAYDVAARNFGREGSNRVILATDGDFNVGASSDAEMVRLIEAKRETGVFLTVLGFGTGNLKDSKMEQLADHGNGNFAYIDGPLEAKKVLVHELGGTLVTVAQDVKVQVEFNPARVAAYRLIGYENRLLADEDFNDDTKDAGELGAGHSVTALYEIVPVGVRSPVQVPGVDPLRYQGERSQADSRASEELMFVKLRYQRPGGSKSRLVSRAVAEGAERPSSDFRFAAAVAAWGMLLRDSAHSNGYSLGEVRKLAQGALGDDPGGYRAEFVRLVDRTRSLELLERRPSGS